MTESVTVDRHDGVGFVLLTEPDTRNALSAAIKARLEVEVPALVADPAVRCILISGQGDAFSAGGDIRSMTEPQPPSSTRTRMARSYGWIGTLLGCEKPVITAVNGPAVGAGFGLAMLGDIVIASDNAWFMGGFSLIGVAADYALGRNLARAVGTVRAKDILLTGRKVDAEEALRIGLVSRLLPAEHLTEEAMKLARSLARGPSVALGLTKSLVDSFPLGTTDYLRMEGFAQATAFSTADHIEGVHAFLDKRKPAFRGE